MDRRMLGGLAVSAVAQQLVGEQGPQSAAPGEDQLSNLSLGKRSMSVSK